MKHVLKLLTTIAVFLPLVLVPEQMAHAPVELGPCTHVGVLDDGPELWAGDCTSAMQPTATQTSPPTATPGRTRTPPLTPTAVSHNTLDWHPPMNGHHHGHDPLDTIYRDYILANWQNTIAHAWYSSPVENVLAPDGKHDGFKYLYEEDTGCFDRTESGQNCPKSYLFKFHSIGTAHATRVRVHSFRLLVNLCGPGGADPCGIVEMGGFLDFGVLHDQYKESLCDLDGSTSYPDDRFQPPYASVNGSARDVIYWNSVINPLVYLSFDPVPQHHVSLAWFELDPWSVPALGPNCADPAFDELRPGNNQSAFQLFIIRVKLSDLPTARPFRGFTDPYGNVDPTCTAEGPRCVPLFIGEGVPRGDALLFRPVRHGDTTHAPIQEFDDGVTEFRMNPYDPEHH